MINKAVLVLNASYEPVSITRAKNALKLLVKGSAVAEEDYGVEVYPGIPLPCVIRLRNYKKIPVRISILTRANIYARDHYLCFAAGTKILLSNGLQKNIEDVVVGDRVIDSHGTPTSVTALGQSVSDRVVRVKHRGSSEETVVTPDHEFLDHNGNFVPISLSPEYLTFPRAIEYDDEIAKDVHISEWLPKEKWFKCHDSRLFWSRRPHEKGLPLLIPASPELARVLGLFVGDGSTVGRGKQTEGSNVSFSFNVAQKESLGGVVKNWAKSIGLDCGEYPSKRSKALSVVISNKMLSMVFRKMCGADCTSKRAPWDQIAGFHKEFLRGLFESDGYIYREEEKITLTLVSFQAIYDAQSMLWGLGIYPTVQRLDRPGRKPTLSLILQAENYGRFMKIVMDEESPQGEPIFGNENYVFRKLQKVTGVNEPTIVYNFETESHSYIANGLAVHNCQYCGAKEGSTRVINGKPMKVVLTLDHVLPESRGGPFAWDNLCACCRTCNTKKGDRTPEEAGMPLLHIPGRLTIHTSRMLLRLVGLDEDARWAKFLFA